MDEPTFYAQFGGPMDLVQQHPELYMKYCMGGKMKKQTGGYDLPYVPTQESTFVQQPVIKNNTVLPIDKDYLLWKANQDKLQQELGSGRMYSRALNPEATKLQPGGNLVPTSYINQFSDNVDVRQSDQRPSLSSYAPMYTSPEEDEQPVKVDKKRLRQEQRAERLEEKQKIKNSHISKYRNVRFLQTGGMPPEMQQAMMQQQAPAPQGGGGAEQAMQQIAQMLQQGMPPEQIIQQLVQSGMPPEQAQQMVQQVAQELSVEIIQSQQGAPQQGAPQGVPMMQTGGVFDEYGNEITASGINTRKTGHKKIISRYDKKADGVAPWSERIEYDPTDSLETIYAGNKGMIFPPKISEEKVNQRTPFIPVQNTPGNQELPFQGRIYQTGSSLTHNDSIVLNKYDAMNDEELQYLERMDNEELLKLLEKRSKINGQKMYTPEDENYLKKANKNDLSMMYGYGGRRKFQTAGPLNTLQEDNTDNSKPQLNIGNTIKESPETKKDIYDLSAPKEDNVRPIISGVNSGLGTVGDISKLVSGLYNTKADKLYSSIQGSADLIPGSRAMSKVNAATKTASTLGKVADSVGTAAAVGGAGLGIYDTWTNNPDNSAGVKTAKTVEQVASVVPAIVGLVGGSSSAIPYGAIGYGLGEGLDALSKSEKTSRGGITTDVGETMGKEALTWAGTGAGFGSMFGPVGTAIGGVVGAIGGGLYGLFSGTEQNNAVSNRNKEYNRQDWKYANQGAVANANNINSDFYRDENKLQTGGYDFKNTKFEPASKVDLNLPFIYNRNYNTYGYGFDMGRKIPAVGAGINYNINDRFNVGANVNTAPSYGVNVGYKLQTGGLPPEMMAAMQQGAPQQQAPPEPYKPGYKDISPSASIDSSLKPISYKGRTHKYGGIEVTDSSELENGEYSVNLTDPQTGAPQRYIFSNATGFAAKAKKILKDYQSQYA